MTTEKKDQDESKLPKPKGRSKKVPAAKPQKEEINNEQSFDDVDSQNLAHETQSEVSKTKEIVKPLKHEVWDEYAIQVYFDKTENQFVGTVLEFPEIRILGPKKDIVIAEIEQRLEQHLFQQKKRNETPVEPFFLKTYPQKLELEISRGLYRRLDVLSRLEKTPIDRLILELISQALGKRFDNPGTRSAGHHERHERHEHRGQNNNRHHNNQNQRNQNYNNNNSNNNNRRNQNRNFHETMENRENFLEYVRNLEKGNTGGWRKK